MRSKRRLPHVPLVFERLNFRAWALWKSPALSEFGSFWPYSGLLTLETGWILWELSQYRWSVIHYQIFLWVENCFFYTHLQCSMRILTEFEPLHNIYANLWITTLRAPESGIAMTCHRFAVVGSFSGFPSMWNSSRCSETESTNSFLDHCRAVNARRVLQDLISSVPSNRILIDSSFPSFPWLHGIISAQQVPISRMIHCKHEPRHPNASPSVWWLKCNWGEGVIQSFEIFQKKLLRNDWMVSNQLGLFWKRAIKRN
jgi:hypothetical protein